MQLAAVLLALEAMTRPLQSETEFIGGKAVLAFRAEDDDEARAILDDEEGSMRSDLKLFVGTDGKPL